MVFRYRFVPPRGFDFVNDAATRMTGYTPAEHYADPDLGRKLIDPDDAPLLLEQLDGGRETPPPVCVRWRRKDGRVIWTEHHNRFIRDEAGVAIAVEGIVRDVTDRVRSEIALRESEARYRRVVEQVPAVTYSWSLTPARELLYISPQIEWLLGYSTEEWRRDPDRWLRLIHPDDLPRVRAALVAAEAAGRPFGAEYRMRRADGAMLWVRDEARRIEDEQGRILGLTGVVTDITGRKEAEEALRQSEARCGCSSCGCTGPRSSVPWPSS